MEEHHYHESMKVNFQKERSFEHPRAAGRQGTGRGSREG